MAVAVDEWLARLEQEYVSKFIAGGGSTVKFVVADESQLTIVAGELANLSQQHNLAYVPIDASTTKLHMIQDVFFAIARALDWNAMAQHFVEALFCRKGYEWPRPGEAVPIEEMAE